MLLLDSQALVWLLDDSPRLGSRARQAITSGQGVYVSAATVWELTMAQPAAVHQSQKSSIGLSCTMAIVARRTDKTG